MLTGYFGGGGGRRNKSIGHGEVDAEFTRTDSFATDISTA